jgi:hypothetical protein
VGASDVSHFYENMTSERPFTKRFHVGNMLVGFDKLRAAAVDENQHCPDHGPLVMALYPSRRCGRSRGAPECAAIRPAHPLGKEARNRKSDFSIFPLKHRNPRPAAKPPDPRSARYQKVKIAGDVPLDALRKLVADVERSPDRKGNLAKVHGWGRRTRDTAETTIVAIETALCKFGSSVQPVHQAFKRWVAHNAKQPGQRLRRIGRAATRSRGSLSTTPLIDQRLLQTVD